MKQRILTAAIGIPIVLAAVLCTNPWPAMALLVLVGFLALRELCRLVDSKLLPFFWLLSIGMLWNEASSIVLGRGSPYWEAAGLTAALIAGVLALLGIRGEKWSPVKLVLGSLWIAAPLRAILATHGLAFSQENTISWSWASPVLMLLLPIWAGDTAAILAGKAFGKHPLAPRISPKKTWEGATANFLACVAIALPLAPAIGFSSTQGLLVGIACGILGQVGDLFESWLKRLSGQKDSGGLLPGHGGILDRIDSLLFAAIPVYAILALLPR